MGRSERDKGLKGEREVAAIFASRGLEVRGLEATGDHLIVCDPSSGLVFHSEVKRQETARVWLWIAQAQAEAAAGAVPIVTFRRNRSRWLSIIDAEQLADLIVLASAAHRGTSGGRK